MDRNSQMARDCDALAKKFQALKEVAFFQVQTYDEIEAVHTRVNRRILRFFVNLRRSLEMLE